MINFTALRVHKIHSTVYVNVCVLELELDEMIPAEALLVDSQCYKRKKATLQKTHFSERALFY